MKINLDLIIQLIALCMSRFPLRNWFRMTGTVDIRCGNYNISYIMLNSYWIMVFVHVRFAVLMATAGNIFSRVTNSVYLL
jgi:hypothetical protein